MDKEERHAFGAHFTREADILKIVLPTIVRPWRQRLEQANTIKALYAMLDELWNYRVLDPACGSGNFLYVAYRELKRIERDIHQKVDDLRKRNQFKKYEHRGLSFLSPNNFFGIDSNKFAVELAKVTLMIAKKLAVEELDIFNERVLPLDNLDNNIISADALFVDWPSVDAIIGNPPFQSKNKMQQEFGTEYLYKLRNYYKRIPGKADYCVYWFRKAHEVMQLGNRAGLVGTNTIRQNQSREGGLDYIVENGGTIVEAVSSQPWNGDAVVHVSIVNWVKGEDNTNKKLFFEKNNELIPCDMSQIPSTLSPNTDITKAERLNCNIESKGCYQGQTHGHEGFLLNFKEAEKLIANESKSLEVIFPYLIANDLLSTGSQPKRYVIDFYPRDINEAKSYKMVFNRVLNTVLPDRKIKYEEENKRNEKVLFSKPNAKVNKHHANFLRYWWHLSYPRADLLKRIAAIDRYIVCSRVTHRPIFEFVDSGIRPSDSLVVFPFEDDYSFGILQSWFHWLWFTEKCSTLKSDFRYTSESVFDTFPWPQFPNKKNVDYVSTRARQLRTVRMDLMKKNNCSLRDLYRTLELPGDNPLRNAQFALDKAVARAYNYSGSDPLIFLLSLNADIKAKERRSEHVCGSGIPL